MKEKYEGFETAHLKVLLRNKTVSEDRKQLITEVLIDRGEIQPEEESPYKYSVGDAVKFRIPKNSMDRPGELSSGVIIDRYMNGKFIEYKLDTDQGERIKRETTLDKFNE